MNESVLIFDKILHSPVENTQASLPYHLQLTAIGEPIGRGIVPQEVSRRLHFVAYRSVANPFLTVIMSILKLQFALLKL